jgi:hypothetical protein
MVVGNNESTTTKNADESLAISMAMAMQRYDARRIAEYIQASLEATGRRHRASACVVSPRRLPWSTILNTTQETLTKHNF